LKAFLKRQGVYPAEIAYLGKNEPDPIPSHPLTYFHLTDPIARRAPLIDKPYHPSERMMPEPNILPLAPGQTDSNVVRGFKGFTLAMVQLGGVGEDKGANLVHAAEMVRRAAKGEKGAGGVDIVMLPVSLGLDARGLGLP
jgi:hypothetical protein